MINETSRENDVASNQLDQNRSVAAKSMELNCQNPVALNNIITSIADNEDCDEGLVRFQAKDVLDYKIKSPQ